MIMAAAGGGRDGRHVTAWSGYDLGYPRKNQGQGGGKPAAKTPGGYYIDAVQGGEPPGSWWGPSAEALGFTAGQEVDRGPRTPAVEP